MERPRSRRDILEDHDARVAVLEDRAGHEQMVSTFEDWRVIGSAGNPAFQNGWTNYNVTNYVSAAFWKDSAGIVHLRGLVMNGTVGTVIFTLPVGYRPGGSGIQRLLFGVHGGGVEGRIDILNVAGDVLHQAGGNAYIQLDGISFRAEQ